MNDYLILIYWITIVVDYVIKKERKKWKFFFIVLGNIIIFVSKFSFSLKSKKSFSVRIAIRIQVSITVFWIIFLNRIINTEIKDCIGILVEEGRRGIGIGIIG